LNHEALEARINTYLQAHFPRDYQDIESASGWIEDKVIRHVEALVRTLSTQFRLDVHDINSKCTQRRSGFFVFLDPGDAQGPTVVKRPGSIIEKMMRSQDAYSAWLSSNKTDYAAPRIYTHENFLTEMDDIVRFRLICNYLDDISLVREELKARYGERRDGLKLLTSTDLFMTPPEQRKGGHRAWHLAFEYRDSRVELRFELQVTTLLHWGWDKKDHSLVYEPTRIGSPPGPRDRISIAAASDTLFLVDEYFDGLRRRMIEQGMRSIS
jgi:ppGpp synthetase/RelA/SpoT-type nucleotidyltranferase